MTAEKTIETQFSRSINEWGGIRDKRLLSGYELQFETPDWPNGWGRPVRNARIINTIGSVASDVMVTIEPLVKKSTDQNFVIVNVLSHINKLSDSQRHVVYGLIASCCREDERPIIRSQEEVTEFIQEEISDFIRDLYHANSSGYNNATRILRNFESGMRSANSVESHLNLFQ